MSAIKDEMQHILEELKLLQSFGVYNRKKIDELMKRRKELQELCTHEQVTVYPEQNVAICEDCGKTFVIEEMKDSE